MMKIMLYTVKLLKSKYKAFLFLTGYLCLPVFLSAQLNDPDPIIIKKHKASIQALAFSNDGATLATAGDDKTIFFWDADTGYLTRNTEVYYMIKALQFISHDEILAASGPDIILLNRAGDILRTYGGYTTDIWSVSFNLQADKVAGGSYSKNIKVWDYKNAELYSELKGHEKSCLPVTLSHDGSKLASGSLDHTVRLWDVSTGEELFKMELHSGNIFSVDFHPSDRYILSCSADKTIRIWDAESGKIVRTCIGHKAAVMDVRFSPDGNHFLSCSADRTIILWETATGEQLYTFTGHTGMVNTVRWNPDGKSFASASEDKTVRIWPMEKKYYVDLFYLNEIENAIAESPLFEPRRKDESRQSFAEREKEAEDFVKKLYNEYYQKYLDRLSGK